MRKITSIVAIACLSTAISASDPDLYWVYNSDNTNNGVGKVGSSLQQVASSPSTTLFTTTAGLNSSVLDSLPTTLSIYAPNGTSTFSSLQAWAQGPTKNLTYTPYSTVNFTVPVINVNQMDRLLCQAIQL